MQKLESDSVEKLRNKSQTNMSTKSDKTIKEEYVQRIQQKKAEAYHTKTPSRARFNLQSSEKDVLQDKMARSPATPYDKTIKQDSRRMRNPNKVLPIINQFFTTAQNDF